MPNSLMPWEDPGSTELTTEQDNALVAEILGGFSNLDSVRVSSGLPFLGLDKGGRWKYGQDAIEPEPASYWALDLPTFKWGWVAWVDSKPTEHMVSIGQPRMAQHELDSGLPWTDQMSIEMVCVSGKDMGTRVVFKTSSWGGLTALQTFKETARRVIPTAPAKPIAVVQLETKPWHSKKYGPQSQPILKIAGWATTGILRNQPEIAAKPAAAPAVEAEAPAPSSRRRRVTN